MKLKITLKKEEYPDELFLEYKDNSLIDKINEIDTIFKKNEEIIIVESVDNESMQKFLVLLSSYNLILSYEYY